MPRVIQIVNSFGSDGTIVSNAKAAVDDDRLLEDLTSITTCYSNLLDLFKRVESSSYNMSCAGDDLLSLNFQNDVGNLKSYIEKRLKKNDLWKILLIHLSDPTVSPSLYAKLRLSQATSVSIERSFSMLKKMLRTDRNFLNDNIEKYVILYYNNSTK